MQVKAHLYLHGVQSFLNANSSSSSQEIPFTLFNPNVHFCEQKQLPHVPSFNQMNSVHVTHPTSVRPILILYFHLFIGLPSRISFQVSPPKFRTHFPSSLCAVRPNCFILLEIIT